MNFCQGFPLSIIIIALVIMIIGAKPWEAPKTNKQRWGRSILTGIGTAIIVINGLAFMGVSQSSGDCVSDFLNLNIGSWAWITIPIFVMTTIGAYIGYYQIIWLHSFRRKIEKWRK